MMRNMWLWLCAIAVLALVVPGHPAGQRLSVVEVARQGGKLDALRTLLKDGADVNAAEGDGMTALHWAAQTDNVELATVLIAAGANLRATTRVGGYTPLLIASESGHAGVVNTLLDAGADPNLANLNGTTPLMLAAHAGNAAAITALLARGAAVNATEKAKGQTALMFAAANGRAGAVRVLAAHGADLNVTARPTDLSPFLEEEAAKRKREAANPIYSESRWGPPEVTSNGPAKPFVDKKPGLERRETFTETVGGWGGLAPLHLAARQGKFDTVTALVEAGADINLRTTGNLATPLAVATISGHFDVSKYLLDHGANPNLAEDNGETPLYAVLNAQWPSKNFYPHPRAQEQQKTSHLELMTALLDKGADPNARTTRKVWTSNFADYDTSGVDDAGATPFWRAAYAADVDALKLLVAHGADPTIPTLRTLLKGRDYDGQKLGDQSGLPPIPIGGAGIPPLLAAAGPGYSLGSAANVHRVVPAGMLPAIKYLVGELHADVNQRDYEGNTAIHNAAARGDNEMIQYLLSKGGDPKLVNRLGQTTVDMANSPTQRMLPYPDTIKLLEDLGVKNNHRCTAC